MSTFSMAKRILVVDDKTSAGYSARMLNVAGFSGSGALRACAANELDSAARRLPGSDHATERLELVVFVVLGLAGFVAVSLAAFGVF
ncbi:MAG: hypothetical protein ABS95_00740 [Verrucomicrobia bacterium SCN 57-15]|nr:MAG: hypothetical protein ABS95_00740 [Verrucomicrobia bacterium SCN 57-15]